MGNAPAKARAPTEAEAMERMQKTKYQLKLAVKKFELDAKKLEKKYEDNDAKCKAEAKAGNEAVLKMRAAEAKRFKEQANNMHQRSVQMELLAGRIDEAISAKNMASSWALRALRGRRASPPRQASPAQPRPYPRTRAPCPLAPPPAPRGRPR